MKSMTSFIFTKCTEDYNAQEWNIEFDRYPNVKYLCGHCISEHLINLDGDVDCCLFVKDKELCICDRFQGEGSKIIMPKKIPKKVTEELQVFANDSRLNNYIEALARI